MFIHLGDRVRTAFLVGSVVRRIDGRAKKFWEPTLYLEVLVEKPTVAEGTKHIIKFSEVKEILS